MGRASVARKGADVRPRLSASGERANPDQVICCPGRAARDEIHFILCTEHDEAHFYARARIIDGALKESFAPVAIAINDPAPLLPLLVGATTLGVVREDGVVMTLAQP